MSNRHEHNGQPYVALDFVRFPECVVDTSTDKRRCEEGTPTCSLLYPDALNWSILLYFYHLAHAPPIYLLQKSIRWQDK